MELNNIEEIARPTADIRIARNKTRLRLFIAVFYVVYLIFFCIGFPVGCDEYYSDGGVVINPKSDMYGYSYPGSNHKYVGWYSLMFSSEGEGWKHNYLYDIGYSNHKTTWGETDEVYPGDIAAFVIINILIIVSPFAFLLIRKAGCKNTVLNLNGYVIYGSAAEGFIKQKICIPYPSINEIRVTRNFLDKVRTGSTLKISYSANTSAFHFVQNPDEIKQYILEEVQKFQSALPIIPASNTPAADSEADELKKFENLPDNGVITEEEFNAKRIFTENEIK